LYTMAAGIPEWSPDALVYLQRLYREGKAAALSQDVEQIVGRKIAPTGFVHQSVLRPSCTDSLILNSRLR
jgi:hypothetical protein